MSGAHTSVLYRRMGLMQASNILSFSIIASRFGGKILRILNIAFLALLARCLAAVEKDPDGVNIVPKYLYSAIILIWVLSI